MRLKGKDSITSTSSSSKLVEAQNERVRIDIFHIIAKHNKVDTLFDSGSQENLIS